ncbi:Nramp family divalent metal transporter [Clostridium tagluense]|uniref:Nramp family divalent metal transporter n=1 Tax=Clostridium tagluense TaxID=360422 RepID=UPI001CF31837|nr:Nramp family divalent metal transporter [Clostridium tagluense]MCB2309696.1 Nramp family divalent metal transporter [Clostridium tagluense]MCB2314774.1 Nramp family divalent metal transporter [Clostridium tagluense]MCB2319623.1 Nramp family divalent metal transporter [Clostridium tagluense]MCB2324290.1 Nramp family divalent metal transporter [Clostridium tagluense]MCB2329141.1 Nramp family divalent metal transporter [Clostridium tagluense]
MSEKTNSNKKPWLVSFMVFLSVLGPGLITGSVDNDAGGISAYSVAGAHYGYLLLWTLIPCFIALLVVQEMNARMGIVTQKGLADLIRENFGVKVTFFIFLGLLVADIGNTATEFAGIAGSLQVFNLSKYVSVPIAVILVWLLVVKGTYKSVEKIFLVFSVFLLSYVFSALLARPDWHQIGTSLINPIPSFNGAHGEGIDAAWISTVIGLIGTTIAPWMQFYMQSSVIEKGIKISEYKYELMDVILGCSVTVVVAFFIIVACAATLNKQGITIYEAKDAAMALKPLAGDLASSIFAFGLLVASVFSATILPLATAFYICEAFGFEAGIGKTMKEAPEFYGLFTAIIIIGAIIILIPGAPLLQISLGSQVINGMLLPVVLICMMLMVNKKDLMGEYTNNKFKNWVGWVTIVILIALTTVLLFQAIIKILGF